MKPGKKKSIKTSKQRIIEQLWRRGELSWLLYDHQLPVYESIKKAQTDEELKFYLNISRRFGKSTILCVLALEQCLGEAKSQVRYAAPSGKEIRKAIIPIIQNLLDSCPTDLKPTYNSVDTAFKFPNKSQLHISGINGGHADDLRGSAAQLVLVDEAAMIDDLQYLVQSVLLPQTITTDALTILASTPAVSRDHDSFQYYLEAQSNNTLAEFTIYDNYSLSKEKIERIKKDNGGAEDTTWLREYMARWVQDSSLDLFPEWDDKFIGEYAPTSLTPYYHRYVSMDIGIVDLTAILYATYDFQKATLYVQAEDIMSGHDLTTVDIHKAVSDRETILWHGEEVYRRISDNNNLILLHDLSKLHDMYFIPTNKDNLDAMMSEVRMFINQGRLIVDKRCEQLLGCLNHGIWSTSKTKREFGRSKIYGHYDAAAALVYLIRNLDLTTNPVPAGLGINSEYYHINKEQYEEQTDSDQIATLKKVFNVR